MICRLLARAQQGDDEAMLELINRFQPLLKKYAKKLRYDDAYEDCLLFFIELVKTMDLKKLNTMRDQSIAAYIKVSVAHFYSKKTRGIYEKEREIAFSDLTEEQRYYVETKTAKQDEQNIFTELGVDKFLNPNEKSILYLVYARGYTIAEIARKYHKSRQTVNQLKMRTLKKLRKIEKGENEGGIKDE
ncbi:sigma-70 family RNA polymerase sigma factor [bacterium 1xD42-87]|nr:sigma-70 family RNA polymerase sigma factor [bacterium 1xD42-87]